MKGNEMVRVCSTRGVEDFLQIFVGKFEETGHMENLDIDGRVILI
jgi:hypothetical protein